MLTLEYRGHKAIAIYFDDEDKFYGKVNYREDIVPFEGSTREELELNFQKIVNEFLNKKRK